MVGPSNRGTSLTEDKIAPDGELLARDHGLGITLWRISGPLVATATVVEGLYPNDTWSGDEVTWTGERCRGGTLTVGLSSDPDLFQEDQLVTAKSRRQDRRPGPCPSRRSRIPTGAGGA